MNIRRSRWIASLLVLVTALSSLPAWAQEAARPWFAFASRDEAALGVINRYFRRGDFLNINTARMQPELRDRIGQDRVFRLSASLEDVTEWAGKPCNDRNSASIIFYDIEGWEATPMQEKADLRGSVARAGEIVKSSGCRTYGIAPGRAYLTGHTRQCEIGVGQLPRGVDWRNVQVFLIQSQGLLAQRCVRRNGVEVYRRFLQDMAGLARAANPQIVVLGEVSFRRSRPDVIVQAIDATKGIVDGYYVAYPVTEKCPDCTPANLEYVLSRYRTPVR